MKRYGFIAKSQVLTILLPFVAVLFMECQGNGGNQTVTNGTDSGKVTATADTVIMGISNPLSGIVLDSNEITVFLNKFPEFKEFAGDFRLFYRNRSYNYSWFDQQGLIEPAEVLLSHLEETRERYISYKIPYQDTLRKLFRDDESREGLAPRKPDATTELMLTGQYFHYAKKRWGQRLEGSQESLEWYLPKKKLDYTGLLQQALEGADYDSITNSVMNRYYLGLRKALNNYRALSNKYPDPLPAITLAKSLKPGDSSASLPLVRQRLHIFGFLPAPGGGNTYDPALISAVNRYKKTIGVKDDGLITKEMVAALNVPIRKRIEQILVNLERLRWMPKVPDQGDMILVNIPEYVLHYFENGNKVWDCNVVVGKTMNKTVIFSGNIKNVVFSPYWYVPPSIINKEVKPGMSRNPNYLSSHNMEWNGGNVRQKPGPGNSLGQVKFIFPNSNNIYLHDTPSKNLFNEDNRAFSHGCVRVGKPRDLAIRILRNQPEWTPAKIDAAMNAGVEKFVPVKASLPVYIGYFTAFVDAEGELNFRKDIYNRDERLYTMLTSGK
jgi:murein L,D-transpeptidase YcbB/YkuD